MSDALPLLLVDPLWERDARAYREASKAATEEAVLVPGLEPPEDRRIVWAEGEREEWLELCARSMYVSRKEKMILETEGWAGLVQAYRDGKVTYLPNQAYLFQAGPEELVRPLLADWNPRTVPTRNDLMALLARFELDARHVVLPAATADAYRNGAALMPLLDADVARLMADWFVRLKSARKIAREWLAGHGTYAVPFLVPDALGKRRVPRDKARAALSLIASTEGLPAVVEAARRYGDPAAEAIEDALGGGAAAAPRAKPVKPAKTPWLNRDDLPDVRLRDGRVLPPDAIENLIGAFVLSPGLRWNGGVTMYPELDDVLEQCDRASVAAFGRAIFECWIAGGMPSRSGWVLDQLCRTADDDAVRRLGTLLLLKWPKSGTDKHAVQVLRVIGTDAALVQLDRIARRASAPGRRRTAEDCLTLLAKARDLTPDELADRLVPDLGLDAAGTLVLDYGPRRFTVGFDEELRPFVVDGAGGHRKALPKPGAADDPELAPAAHRRFAALKKEVRDVAGDQIRRLERTMVTGRELSAAEFRRYFVEHPLLWHIARRLVWTADGVPFRLAEDRTAADVHDAAVRLPGTARIGIPHPVRLGDALPAWTELFADYEIVQPFAQLGRPLGALTADERDTGRLARFEGLPVRTGALLGLLRRGWERGPVEDGGVFHSIVRRFPDRRPGLAVEFALGIAVTGSDPFGDHKLHAVRFDRPPGADLDAVTASELLADLTGLTDRTA